MGDVDITWAAFLVAVHSSMITAGWLTLSTFGAGTRGGALGFGFAVASGASFGWLTGVGMVGGRDD